MSITKETVEYVAHLSRIELQSNELEILSGQLKGILDFIDKLTKIDIQNITPTSHILPLNNVLRQDLLGKSLLKSETLKNAPSSDGSFFMVPKVIE